MWNSGSHPSSSSILKLFAADGVNGVRLETTRDGNQWYTTREAVERFMARTFRRSR